MSKFNKGEVVHINQGHPDDNFYDVIVAIHEDHVELGNDLHADFHQLRHLTDVEKGFFEL